MYIIYLYVYIHTLSSYFILYIYICIILYILYIILYIYILINVYYTTPIVFTSQDRLPAAFGIPAPPPGAILRYRRRWLRSPRSPGYNEGNDPQHIDMLSSFYHENIGIWPNNLEIFTQKLGDFYDKTWGFYRKIGYFTTTMLGILPQNLGIWWDMEILPKKKMGFTAK